MSKPPPPDLDLYDRLVQAYRLLNGPHHKKAAALASTVPVVARHAWEYGWEPDGESYMPPIRDGFAKEALEARVKRAKITAALVEAREIDLTQQQDDHALQRALEGIAARAGVVSAEKLLQALVQMTTDAAEMLAPKFMLHVRKLAADPETNAHEISGVFGKLAKNLKEAVEALERAQHADRTAMGEDVIKIQHTHKTEPAEAVRDIFRSIQALQSAAQSRLPSPQPAHVVTAEPARPAQPSPAPAPSLASEGYDGLDI